MLLLFLSVLLSLCLLLLPSLILGVEKCFLVAMCHPWEVPGWQPGSTVRLQSYAWSFCVFFPRGSLSEAGMFIIWYGKAQPGNSITKCIHSNFAKYGSVGSGLWDGSIKAIAPSSSKLIVFYWNQDTLNFIVEVDESPGILTGNSCRV